VTDGHHTKEVDSTTEVQREEGSSSPEDGSSEASGAAQVAREAQDDRS